MMSLHHSSLHWCLSLSVLCYLLLVGSAFIVPSIGCPSSSFRRTSTTTSSAPQDNHATTNDKNSRFVEGLLDNLAGSLDKWVISGSPASKERVYNVFNQIEAQAKDPEHIKTALRLIRRAGLPIQESFGSNRVELGRTDEARRREEADQRQRWESSRANEIGKTVSDNISTKDASFARSALGRREAANGKPDVFLSNVDRRLDPESFAEDKLALQKEMDQPNESTAPTRERPNRDVSAAAKVSEIVARAGAGSAFEGETLGIGGLDDVLAQIKRRVWIPLAAPPQLLAELGIHPVRGLLLYGKPGCGKTLLARKIGQMLSPMRPITVVSGPEVLDKFVGSSEKNLREIFDSPPDIFDFYRIGQSDGGEAIERAALHVVIMDEFDAIARTRGGKGGSGDQGDAGVARDSVVNQLLAKMDGVDPLKVPTLVIGLTNKRSLIEPALLRPGRFEVQVEVPPPRTVGQRVSILKVHTRHMQQAGRLLVSDAPEGSPASKRITGQTDLPTYEDLLVKLANECDGYSGASLAAVCRAAASHALERAVEEFTQHIEDSSLLADCLVTESDFCEAIEDVNNSRGDSDWTEDEDLGLPDSGGKEADMDKDDEKP